MGWEQRGNRSYYYRKERDGARVRSVYLGGGETAVLISRCEAQRRSEKKGKRRRERRERERLREQGAELDRVCEMVETLTAGVLLAAGYHTHKRQWRRKRDEGSRGEGRD